MTVSPVPPLRLATRASDQARTQAELVAASVTAASGRSVELVFVTTQGDRRHDVALHTIGGQGVFVKEVQQAVLDGRADAAVHSAKDLPTGPVEGLAVAAWCARRDPADALIGAALGDLADGARVATGSVRRRALLAVRRPDLRFVELRGNIARRLEQVPPGGALVMAVAALEILGLTERIAERLDPAWCVPAVGQGCVAVEIRDDDAAARAALAPVDDPDTSHAVQVERAFLAELGSGCSLPIGAWATTGSLRTMVASHDPLADPSPVTCVEETVPLTGDLDQDRALGAEAARRALAQVGVRAD